MLTKMTSQPYITYTNDQLNKIGHTVIYLANHVPQLTKTKLLKLLYIIEEVSIQKWGIPVLNLKFKVWKFGPVSEELFVDLSTDTVLLSKFIIKQHDDAVIRPKLAFSDDEFSDNDIEVLEHIVSHFGQQTATELVSYTHRHNSPWHNTAKQHNVLELLENEKINNTEFVIDMAQLIANDPLKTEIYLDYLETH